MRRPVHCLWPPYQTAQSSDEAGGVIEITHSNLTIANSLPEHPLRARWLSPPNPNPKSNPKQKHLEKLKPIQKPNRHRGYVRMGRTLTCVGQCIAFGPHTKLPSRRTKQGGHRDNSFKPNPNPNHTSLCF